MLRETLELRSMDQHWTGKTRTRLGVSGVDVDFTPYVKRSFGGRKMFCKKAITRQCLCDKKSCWLCLKLIWAALQIVAAVSGEGAIKSGH